MMSRKTGSTHSYHRENLRRDLLEAGFSYVCEHGHDTLSVRTLASIVGVSSGAPYHHFADRRALLLALACDGYDRLSGVGADNLRAISDPLERLRAISRHFLLFAHQYPRLFDLMYESELTRPQLDPLIKEAQLRGFALLKEAMAEVVPDIPEKDFATRILSVWSALFGFAMIRNKEIIKPYEMSQDIADSVVEYIIGIAASVR
ncbi:TetR/AcrR family transcriptional regulator [Niveispirillum sp. SYP-B3756]|uniref:TetR/AcrR family transcriptional regulator n=1 Tax=Niveispirillum sp. SYP-B3756 TaxID=2662178 RepID=UPI001B3B9008|nr:TetR/AcrR family transcriptional regulator [Niveispirillum sp. SYP-B3756]